MRSLPDKHDRAFLDYCVDSANWPVVRLRIPRIDSLWALTIYMLNSTRDSDPFLEHPEFEIRDRVSLAHWSNPRLLALYQNTPYEDLRGRAQRLLKARGAL